MHPRQKIRQAIMARLATPDAEEQYPTQALARVYGNRAKPLFPKDLPAILVYTRLERIAPESQQGDGLGPWQRTLQLAVEIVDQANGELDDRLDRIAEEVEHMLASWEIPDFPSATLHLMETELSISEEGERLLGAARLTYEVVYWSHPQMDGPDGALPMELYHGWSPRIGADHEPDYVRIA